MKFSTASLYGLRAMIYLAEKGKTCSIKEISNKKGISSYYLEKILNKLKKMNLLKSKRGKNGGYFLAKKANKIKVGEIVRALEGEIAPAYCLSKEIKKLCPHTKDCRAQKIWGKVQKTINSVLDSITLADLAENEKKR